MSSTGMQGEEVQTPVLAESGHWWGLRFESGSRDVEALEESFQAARSAAHQATAAVLSAGVALVHALLAFKLYAQGQSSLAAAAAATMAQQLLVWLIAVLAPRLFSKLRPILYTFSVTVPAVQSSPLVSGSSSSMAVVNFASPTSPSFWISQLLDSGVPWLVVHAVLFPLTVNQGLLAHGMAVAILLSSNRQRCMSSLQQCPAASPLLAKLAAGLQRLSIFSASPRSWLLGSDSAAEAASGVSGGSDVASPSEIRSCMAVYASLQIALGYLAVLQLVWWLDRAARLAYLRRTEEVEAEWRLERKVRPAGTLALELAALLLLAWQLVDLWMATAADWGGAGSSSLSSAHNSTVSGGHHSEL